VLLQAEGLKYQNRLDGVLIEVRHGEIVRLAGLLGSGRSETARALFGAEPLDGGTVKLEGSLLSCVVPMTPSMRDGFPQRTARRTASSLSSVRENLTLAALPALTQWGIVSRKRQGELVDRFMQRLGIKAASAEQKIHELGRQSAEGPSGAMAVQEYETSFSSTSRLAVSTLVQRARSSGSSLNWRSRLGVLMISSEVEELVEGSQRRRPA